MSHARDAAYAPILPQEGYHDDISNRRNPNDEAKHNDIAINGAAQCMAWKQITPMVRGIPINSDHIVRKFANMCNGEVDTESSCGSETADSRL